MKRDYSSRSERVLNSTTVQLIVLTYRKVEIMYNFYVATKVMYVTNAFLSSAKSISLFSSTKNISLLSLVAMFINPLNSLLLYKY